MFFVDAVCHLCRISRIIRQQLGNALLIGMGGSGNKPGTKQTIQFWFFIFIFKFLNY